VTAGYHSNTTAEKKKFNLRTRQPNSEYRYKKYQLAMQTKRAPRSEKDPYNGNERTTGEKRQAEKRPRSATQILIHTQETDPR
jgi:hypothetical protein